VSENFIPALATTCLWQVNESVRVSVSVRGCVCIRLCVSMVERVSALLCDTCPLAGENKCVCVCVCLCLYGA